MNTKLSTGILAKLLNGVQVEKPILQILAYKRIPGGTDRYRLVMSDGVNSYNVTMLATQLNDRILNGDFERNTIVSLDKYLVNQVPPTKRVIILLGMTVIAPGETVGDKIGNPVPLDSNQGGSSADDTSTNNQTRTNNNSRESQPQRTLQPPANSGFRPNVSNHNNSTDMSNVNVHPISSLTPYQNKWTIRARVTNKTPIRTWSNSRGEGKLFSVDLLDESGEIRATAFKDQADKFFDVIEINKVYYISKGTLKTANKNFTSIKNDYEMSFNSETTVVTCEDNPQDIPMLQYDFTQISEVKNVDKDALIDIIGICKTTGDVQTFTSKNTNKELTKRDLVLLDNTCTEINVTLWGAEAEKFDGNNTPVVAVKGARVSDFGGRSLSMLNSSVMQVNPDIKEAHSLRGWYDSGGASEQTQTLTVKGGGPGGNTNWKTFAQAKGENLGLGEKPDYYTTKASVVMVKRDNCLYQACPQEDCNKKVVDMNNGLYRCEKCNQEFDSFKWRMLLQINIADFSDSQWVTCFQESAEIVLGTSAQELGNVKESDEERYGEIINEANFKAYTFKLRAKMDMFNDESRLKTVVFQVTPLNYLEYGRKLLTDIKNLEKSL